MPTPPITDALSEDPLDRVERFADEPLPPQPRLSGERHWGFVRRPRWIVSHLFAISVIVVMVVLGFWQLHRLDERRATNAQVAAQSEANPVSVAAALALASADREFTVIEDEGSYVDPEIVRVANRSQGGAAGDWVIGLFRTDDGLYVLVNRGFLTREEEAAVPADGPLVGWLRSSQQKTSALGGTDTGDTFRVPRLDVAAIAGRAVDAGEIDGTVAPMWVQMAPPERAYAPDAQVVGTPLVPDPVPLPPLDEGPHLSYAMQWFTFSLMGAFVYGLILLRRAGERSE